MIEEQGILYLEVEDVLSMFALQFDCQDTQEAADQLRGGPGGLEGALARPRMAAYYSGADVASQAALLVHGIAEGQYFIDGNKSTAFLACILFLEENGYALAVPDDSLREWILDLSSGLTVDDLAERLRPWLPPADNH